MKLWFHCDQGWRTVTCVRFVFILLKFHTPTCLQKLQQIPLWGIAHFHCTGNASQVSAPAFTYKQARSQICCSPLHSCCQKRNGLHDNSARLAWRLLPLQEVASTLWTELLWSAPSKYALTDASLKSEGFFCHFPWGCTHNPCRLWGLDGGLFSHPLSLYHHGWHGNLPAVSPAPNCTSPPAGTGGLLLWEQNLHEKYHIKSNTSVEISLGLKKRDEIISLCLFPVEVSSVIPGQQRFQKRIAANAAFYFHSVVINPRLQTHLDSFQYNGYFTRGIHVENSSFLEVFYNRLK